jgi:glycosyltransferase involved in cell wall biosynthesis
LDDNPSPRERAASMVTVLAITSGMQQAAARLRMGELISPLRERGIELSIAAWGKTLRERRTLIRSAASFDAVILQRRLLDPRYARALRRRAKKIYFDVDDAVMYHAGQVGWWSRRRTERRFAATCRILDHVVAGNEYLAEIFRARGCTASVLPTMVDPLHYQVKLHRATDSPRLVWIGSHSTIGYLQTILPALASASQTLPGLRLTVIADRTLENAPLPVDFVEWSEAGEAAALASADIGIAPTPDDRWTRGKCGFKIVQYMAAGLPVIASPIGANAVIVREGQTGYLADSTEAWTARLIGLAGDATRRATLGAAGRRDVWSIYNLSRAADFWTDLLMAGQK